VKRNLSPPAIKIGSEPLNVVLSLSIDFKIPAKKILVWENLTGNERQYLENVYI